MNATTQRPRAPAKPTKVFELYRRGLGGLAGFSARLADYRGASVFVAAVSLRQAYALAYKDAWIDPAHQYPVGVVAAYRRSAGCTLWCGCTGHHLVGRRVEHGDRIGALRDAIDTHGCAEAGSRA